MISLLKVLFISLILVVAYSIQGVGLNPIKPLQLNKGKQTSYLFSIDTEE